MLLFGFSDGYLSSCSSHFDSLDPHKFDCCSADVNLENSSYFISLCVCVCACACARACVRARARVCVCVSTVRSIQQEDIRLSSLV